MHFGRGGLQFLCIMSFYFHIRCRYPKLRKYAAEKQQHESAREEAISHPLKGITVIVSRPEDE